MDAYGFWTHPTSDCIHGTALLHLATRVPTLRAESHHHHRGQEPESLEKTSIGLGWCHFTLANSTCFHSIQPSPGQARSHTSIDHGQKGVPLAGSWEEKRKLRHTTHKLNPHCCARRKSLSDIMSNWFLVWALWRKSWVTRPRSKPWLPRELLNLLKQHDPLCANVSLQTINVCVRVCLCVLTSTVWLNSDQKNTRNA